MRGTKGDESSLGEDRVLGGALPDLADLDLLALSRGASHPVLRAVAASLLPRMQSDSPVMAFYEDSPYQL